MKKLILILLLLLPCVGLAQGVPFSSSASPITNGLGQPIAGVTISVCTAAATIPPTCGAPVTIYKDAALQSPYTTLTTDGFGNFYFFIAPASNSYCYTTVAPPITGTVCQPFGVPIAPGSAPSFASVTLSEGTAPSGLAGFDILYGDSSLHRPRFINNNGAAVSIALLSDSLASFTGTLTSAQLAALVTDETGTGPLVFANGGTIAPTSVTTGQIIQPAATAFTIKDNQGGTRYSIPSGGVLQGQINNTSLTGASTSNTVNLFASGCTPQGPTASINGTGAAVDIFTCALPVNVVENNKLLHVICSGIHDTGTTSVAMAMNINGQNITSGNTGTTGSQSWSMEAYILRTGTTTGQAWGISPTATGNNGTMVAFSVGLTGLSWTSGTQTLNCQFTVAAGDHMTGRVWAPMSIQ